MFGNIGAGEIVIIMVLALLFFGPKKLPEIGRSIGNAMKEFRRASSDFMDAIHNPDHDQDDNPPPVANIEYPTPALAGADNQETLPYGSDFYPAGATSYSDGVSYQSGGSESEPQAEAEAELDPAREDLTPQETDSGRQENSESVSERKV